MSKTMKAITTNESSTTPPSKPNHQHTKNMIFFKKEKE